MVAVVSGNDLGLFSSSLAKLGSSSGGQPGVGAANVGDYVNVATGNLVLRDQEDLLIGHGMPLPFVQTYNSQGAMGSAGGWLSNFDSSVTLTGTYGDSGSTVTRTDGDGATTTFTWDAGRGKYVSQQGSGADDTLEHVGTSTDWTWTEGSSRTQMVYDSSGVLQQVDDAKSGATFTLGYTSGKLTSISNNEGDSLSIHYDGNGNIACMETKEGSTVLSKVQYEYDTDGRLSKVHTFLKPGTSDATTYDTTYTYESSSYRLSSVVQSDGTELHFTYDTSGRIASVTQGAVSGGLTTSFTYGSGYTDVKDGLNRTTRYSYDTDGNLTEVKSPAVNGQYPVTDYAYTDGRLTSITDGSGHTVSYGYDADGNLVYQQDPTGATITRKYNGDDQLIAETVYTVADSDPADTTLDASGGATTRYVYDGNDRLKYVISAEGEVTENTYGDSGDADGLLVSTRTYIAAEDRYDTSGLTNDEAPSLEDMDTWAHGDEGTETDPTAHIGQSTLTEYSYDVLGQLSYRTTYASVDAITGEGSGTDAANAVTHYVYDVHGRLSSSATVRGSGADVTHYTYDGIGRLKTTTDALGNVTTRCYEDSGMQLVVTAANGSVTTEVHDATGELVSVVQSATSLPTRTTQYYYDDAGQLVASQDAEGGISYNFYDDAGRLSASVDATGAVTAYTYDNAGHLIRSTAYATRVNTSAWISSGAMVGTLTLPSGGTRVTRYFYDDAGRKVGTLDAKGYLTTVSYDGAGRVTQTTAYAVQTDSADWATGDLDDLNPGSDPAHKDRITQYYYDADGRQVGVLDAAGYLTETQYDAAGRVTATIAYAGATGSGTTGLYTDGPLSGLLIARDSAHDQTTRYFYDGAGNKTGMLDAENHLTTWTYTQATRSVTTTYYMGAAITGLTGGETLSYLVSHAGSTTETSTCVYDELGRKYSETDRSGTITRYDYDVMGRLTSTRVLEGTTELRADYKRYDLYGNLIGELSGQGVTAAETYLAGLTTPPTPPITLATADETTLITVYQDFGTTYQYDKLGRLIQRTDAITDDQPIDLAATNTWYFYDLDGRLTHTIKTLSKDGSGNVLGQVSETVYDAFGGVQETVQYAATLNTGSTALTDLRDHIRTALSGQAGTTTYSFINATLASNDAAVLYTRDDRGQVTQMTDALGKPTGYAYDAFGDLTQLTSQVSSSVSVISQYLYDTRGQRTQAVADQGTGGHLNATTQETYDAFGRVHTSTDANGNVTTYAYDRLGRATSVTQTVDGAGRTTSTEYDVLGRVTQVTDATGQATSYVYDDAARTLTVTSPEGVETVTSYDRFGKALTVTTGEDTTTYTYDDSGQLLTVVDSDGHTTASNTYDTVGRLETSTDATGVTVSYAYDPTGRVLTRTVDPSGLNLATHYAYSFDSAGGILDVTDTAGTITRTHYDLDGRVTSTVTDYGTGKLNLTTAYTYDDQGRQTSVTVGSGTGDARVTAYDYDALGRLTSKVVNSGSTDSTDPERTTAYAYDGNGNLVKTTDADGNVTRYAYDAANELVYTLTPSGTSSDPQVSVEQRSYDSAGRLTAVTRFATGLVPDGGTGTLDTSHLDTLSGQDAAAYVAGFTGATGFAKHAQDATSYTVYDTDGRAAYAIDANGIVTHNVFDDMGRIVEQVRYAGVLDITDDLTDTVRGDLAGGLIGKSGHTSSVLAISSHLSDSDTANHLTQTTYDAAGHARFVVTTVKGGSSAVSSVLEQRYDSAGKLVTSISRAVASPSSPGALTYAIATSTYGTLATDDQATSYFYDTAGRLVYTVDADGNVTKNGYDTAGRVNSKKTYNLPISLTGITTTAGVTSALASIGSEQTQYAYDAAGRLTSTTDALGQVESYTYDATGLKTSYTDKGGAVTNYAYFKDGSLKTQTGPLVKVAYYNSDGTSANENASIVTSYTYDAMGNVSTITQASNGAHAYSSTTTYHYDAAGRQIQIDYPDTDSYSYSSGTYTFTAAGSTVTTVQVKYDALGRAYANKDQEGNWSYKVYDAGGRVALDVDAAGGVTATEYDAFGNAHVVTRYADAANLDSTHLGDAGLSAGGQITADYIFGSHGGVDADNDDNRTVTMEYDGFGNKTSITQSSVNCYTLDTDPTNYIASSTHTPSAPSMAGGSPQTTYTYDIHGNQTSQSVLSTSGSWNTTYDFYDAAGRKITEIDAAGYVTTWTYDAHGRVSSTTQYAQSIYPFSGTLSASSRPPAATEDSGADRTTSYDYDALGRVTQQSTRVDYQNHSGAALSGDLVTATTYDDVARTVTTTVAGVATVQAYDAAGHLISVTGGAHSALTNGLPSAGTLQPGLDNSGLYSSAQSYTDYAYDAFGNRVRTRVYADGAGGSSTDTDNLVSYAQYDQMNRQIFTQDAAGNKTYNIFDDNGRLITTRYDLQTSSTVTSHVFQTYTYDAAGRQLTSVLARNSTGNTDSSTTTVYNAFGEAVSVTTDNSYQDTPVVHTYQYDDAGRLTSKDLGTEGEELYRYDLAGNRIATVDTAGHYTYGYVDALGRTVTQVQPWFTQGSGGSTTYTTPLATQTYDRWGNVTKSVDAMGYVTRYYYNSTNQAVKVVQPTVKVVDSHGAAAYQRPEVDYWYDIQGRQIGMTDADGNKTKTYYDDAGEVTKTVDGVGNVTLNAYDILGRKLATEDGSGYITTTTYNKINQTTGQGDIRVNSAGTGYTNKTLASYAVNRNGDRVSSTDALSKTSSYSFDARGNVLSSTTAEGVLISYQYDAAGNKTSYTDHYGSQTWQYDSLGRLATHVDLAGATHTYIYDAGTGLLSMEGIHNSLDYGGSNYTDEHNYTYYRNGLLKQVDNVVGMIAGTGGTHSYYTYTYDAKGERVTTQNNTHDGNSHAVNELTTTEYDSHGRMTRVTTQNVISGDYTLDMQYEYDAQGNRRHIRVQTSYGDDATAITYDDAAPVKVGTVNAIHVLSGDSTSFTVDAGEIFQDAEGEGMTYDVKRSNGTALPTGLTAVYDPVTHQFEFTVDGSTLANGTYTIRLYANDGVNSTSTHSDFTFSVGADTTPVSTGTPPSQIAKIGDDFEYQLLASDWFSDPDLGDTLTLSLASGSTLPPGITADGSAAGTLLFSGTPTGSPGTYNLTVVATDEDGNTATITQTIVTKSPVAPTATGTAMPTDKEATIERSFGFSLPVGTYFTDGDGDDMAFNVTLDGGAPLPDWMNVSYSTDGTPSLVFSGMPPDDAYVSGSYTTYTVAITASDGEGSVTRNFDFKVYPNRAPDVESGSVTSAGWQVGTGYSDAIPIGDMFDDPDGDALQFTLKFPTGTGLDWSWLHVDTDGDNILLSGTTPSGSSYAGNFTLTVIASDGELSASKTFTLKVTGTLSTGSNIPDQSPHVGSAFSYTFPSGAFTEVNGTLTYTAGWYQQHSLTVDGVTTYYWLEGSLPSWLSFNASTRTFSGTPPSANLGDDFIIRVHATDASSNTVYQDFNLVPSNSSPVVNTHIPNKSGTTGTSFSYQIPSTYFSDPDGDTLTYSATGKPPGISFNASTRTFSGTPTTAGTYNVTVTATDPYGAYVTDVFTFTVAQGNRAPTVAHPIPDQSVERLGSYSYTFPSNTFNDADGDTLTYTAIQSNGSALPSWLSFTPSTRHFSGSPPLGMNMELTLVIKVTATDPDGASVSDSFNLTLEPFSGGGGMMMMSMGMDSTEDDVGITPGDAPDDSPDSTTDNFQDFWYTYDKDNRVLTVDGKLNSANNIQVDGAKSTSYTLSYDAQGNIVTQNTGGSGAIKETFQYATTNTGHTVTMFYTLPNDAGVDTQYLGDIKTYDIMGRLTKEETYNAGPDWVTVPTTEPGANYRMSITGWLMTRTTWTYDDDGNMLSQVNHTRTVGWMPQPLGWMTDANYPSGTTVLDSTTLDVTTTAVTNTYDLAGRLSTYVQGGTTYHDYYQNSAATYGYYYGTGDNWQLERTTESGSSDYTQLYYNNFGEVTEVDDVGHGPSEGTGLRFMAYDAFGNVIYRQAGYYTSGSTTYHQYLNGDGSVNLSQKEHFYTSNGAVLTSVDEDGDIQFAGATNFSSGEAPGHYTVQGGDTLQSIAQMVYGNAQLWYVIADANAIASNDDLRAGMQLSYPVHVTDNNDAGTFRPYSPMEAIGGTTPNPPSIPVPQDQGCNTLGMIVVIVVAIVVDYVTMGAASPYMNSLAAAAIAGTAASVVSQEVAVGMGMQDHFSLSQALEAGATAAIGQGIINEASTGDMTMSEAEAAKKGIDITTTGSSTMRSVASYLNAGPGASFGQYLARGAFNYATGYTVDKALGGNQAFSWKGFVSQSVGSAVGAELGNYVNEDVLSDPHQLQFVNDFTYSTVNAFATAGGVAAVNHLIGGPGANYAQIAVDAFANAIGNSLIKQPIQKTDVEAMQREEEAKLASQERPQPVQLSTLDIGPTLAYVQAPPKPVDDTTRGTSSQYIMSANNNNGGTGSDPYDPQKLMNDVLSGKVNSSMMNTSTMSMIMHGRTGGPMIGNDFHSDRITPYAGLVPGGDMLADPQLYRDLSANVDTYTHDLGNDLADLEYEVGKGVNWAKNALGLGDEGSKGAADAWNDFTTGADHLLKLPATLMFQDPDVTAEQAWTGIKDHYGPILQKDGLPGLASALTVDAGSQVLTAAFPEMDLAEAGGAIRDISLTTARNAYNSAGKTWNALGDIEFPLSGTGGASSAYNTGQINLDAFDLSGLFKQQIPHGFADQESFDNFATSLNRGLSDAGYINTSALFQGSSVTGVSFRTGAPFDAGRISDFDIALGGDDIFSAANDAGISLRGSGTRTGPLDAGELDQLGLSDLASSLTIQAGRPVKFMIYNSPATAFFRSPSILVPKP